MCLRERQTIRQTDRQKERERSIENIRKNKDEEHNMWIEIE